MKLASACGAVLLGVLVAPACKADLKADYQFANTFASSVGTAPPLTPIEQGGTTGMFATETVDGNPNTPVFTFSENRGLIADTNGVVPSDNYSVVFYTRLTVIAPPVMPIVKILDFRNRTSDAGEYVVAGVPTFYDGLLMPIPPGGTATIMDDVYAQFVLTRDDLDNVNVYLDGTLHHSFVDSGDLTVLKRVFKWIVEWRVVVT